MTKKLSLFQTTDLGHAKPYQQQLADKKSHLLMAKQCLQESAQLIKKYQEQLATKEQELVLLNRQIAKDDNKDILLNKRKKEIQQFIAEAPTKLAPYLLRFAQLEADVEQFESHIRDLIHQIQQKKHHN